MEPVQWFIFGLFISKHMKAVQGEHEFDKWYTNFPAISVGIKKKGKCLRNSIFYGNFPVE